MEHEALAMAAAENEEFGEIVTEATPVRRGSFVGFVLATAAAQTAAPEGLQCSTWDRSVHVASLLGYSLMVSGVMLVYIVALDRIEWGKSNDGGVLVLNPMATWAGVIVPSAWAFWILNYANVAFESAFDHAGPRMARWSVAVGSFLVPLICGVVYALQGLIDLRYTMVDLVSLFLFVAAFIALDMKGRRWWARRGEVADLPANPDCAPQAPQDRSSVFHTLIPMVSGLTIFFGYPILIVPAFMAAGSTIRLVICLIVHPILLESAEVIGRASSAEGVALSLREGKITLDEAETRTVQRSVLSFGIKCEMAMFRRLFLLNMGGAGATITAPVPSP